MVKRVEQLERFLRCDGAVLYFLHVKDALEGLWKGTLEDILLCLTTGKTPYTASYHVLLPGNAVICVHGTFIVFSTYLRGHFTAVCHLGGHPRGHFLVFYLPQGHRKGHFSDTF